MAYYKDDEIWNDSFDQVPPSLVRHFRPMERVELPDGFTCVHCDRTSYNANDLRERYCGACHHFCDDVPAAEQEATDD